MAGEVLSLQVGENGPLVSVQCAGNVQGTGWSGTVTSPWQPPVGEFEVTVESGPLKNMRALVEIRAKGGSFVMLGRTGLRW